ncbi:Nucleolar protein 12 [Dissostichus eleginoides]|uniref:Nucleolar protein 12 n=1 Tax=Dissostichus eleginoides TaxID=100907 RepID=A0AAD9B714_DISEL|nr:Nucleolar protein 12 [Dissostichus eleginoides]
MKNLKKPNNNAKNGKFKPGSKKRENKCIVSFDANDRQDYLTGFHKRKVERRKVAVAEIKKKIKEEQIRVREERHKEYLRLLKERTDALEECEEDDLEDVITATTESVQYDHPNHTVTVTTISDLDLSGAHLLGPAETEGDEEGKEEGKEGGKEEEEELREERRPMPRKSGNPIMNKKIRSLNKSLTTFTAKKQKRKSRATEKKSGSSEVKKRGKWQRRRLTGKKLHHRNE